MWGKSVRGDLVVIEDHGVFDERVGERDGRGPDRVLFVCRDVRAGRPVSLMSSSRSSSSRPALYARWVSARYWLNLGHWSSPITVWHFLGPSCRSPNLPLLPPARGRRQMRRRTNELSHRLSQSACRGLRSPAPRRRAVYCRWCPGRACGIVDREMIGKERGQRCVLGAVV